jgi:hypothetical protein
MGGAGRPTEFGHPAWPIGHEQFHLAADATGGCRCRRRRGRPGSRELEKGCDRRARHPSRARSTGRNLLATVHRAAATVEPYVRVDGTKVWSVMQLERQLRPRAYGVARPEVESSTRLGRHRWKVERSLSWLSCFRRLGVRCDRDSGRWFAFVLLACALVCFKGGPSPVTTSHTSSSSAARFPAARRSPIRGRTGRRSGPAASRARPPRARFRLPRRPRPARGSSRGR